MLNESPMEAEAAVAALRIDVDLSFQQAVTRLREASFSAQSIELQKRAVNILTKSRSKLKSTLSATTAQLTWTPFAAFYGETNAGKSTLIAALRLYFDEKTLQAGISIGDGRSDFTQEATYYPCIFRNRAFILVDLPGIEGKESIVEDAIKSALARSHVVFFITTDARPPQGGEVGREGTLQKMARQLKPQAKVWAIWNKKIQNPRALTKPLLVEGSDEWRSLHDGVNSLDGKLHEAFGMRYQTCLPVSALPAFLALATDLAPESKKAEERTRFLECIPKDRILEMCGIGNVVSLIVNGMPDEHDIFEANLRKLSVPIQEYADLIAKKARADFLKPALELKTAIRKLKPRLDGIAEDAHRNLRRLSEELIQSIIAAIRLQTMTAIQAGIYDNKELKIKVEDILSKERQILAETIRSSIEDNISDTRKSIQESLEIMKVELTQANSFSVPGFTANFDHTVEMNIENGVDWTGLGAAVVAGVVAVILTGGWVLVLSIIGALMGAWNALAALFNPQHKKDQQRKVLNSKLYLVRKELTLSVPKKMDEIAEYVTEFVCSQAEPFERLSADYFKAGQMLLDVSRKLSGLSERPYRMSAT